MDLPIKLISTDFDGTLHADYENPPVPERLQELIGGLQQRGAKWVINTGRDLSSLMEGLGRAHLSIQPDWLVTVEREIYFREGHRFFPLQPWNGDCERAHRELFKAVEKDLPRLFKWVNGRFHASVYSDAYSPFCLIAGTNADADDIEAHLTEELPLEVAAPMTLFLCGGDATRLLGQPSRVAGLRRALAAPRAKDRPTVIGARIDPAQYTAQF